jgi:hypothetical protein
MGSNVSSASLFAVGGGTSDETFQNIQMVGQRVKLLCRCVTTSLVSWSVCHAGACEIGNRTDALRWVDADFGSFWQATLLVKDGPAGDVGVSCTYNGTISSLSCFAERYGGVSLFHQALSSLASFKSQTTCGNG